MIDSIIDSVIEPQAETLSNSDYTQRIAYFLNEKNPFPWRSIWRAVRRIGPDQVMLFAQRAYEIEVQGGMDTITPGIKRTVGGIFFFILKQHLSPEDRAAIFYPRTLKRKPAVATPQTPIEPPIEWIDRHASIQASRIEKGDTTTVRITLVGKPGRIVKKGQCVMTTMQNTHIPQLPNGVPAPPTTPTDYMIYIAQKQWNKVATAMENPDDALIINGYATYDPDLEGIAVFVTSLTTKHTEMAKQAKQSA